MNPKVRVLAVLARQPVDLLPVDPGHAPEIGSVFAFAATASAEGDAKNGVVETIATMDRR